MMELVGALELVLRSQSESGMPIGIVVAGHNGSGKSTMWRDHLSPKVRIPLINADRMMLSILPEMDSQGRLPLWARRLRDGDESWMRVAQKGVEAFVAQAMLNKVPFAMETVFSHWVERPDGTVDSKVDLVKQMQAAGYFVLIAFVGLTTAELSLARVQTRVAQGGHDVAQEKLIRRFGRTQRAITQAALAADITVMLDNSRDEAHAFTVCRIQSPTSVVFDIRQDGPKPPAAILGWLDIVSPNETHD